MRTILVVSTSDDPAVELVASALKALGDAELVLFPTDLYPFEASVSVSDHDTQLTSTSGSVKLSEVDAVWMRRIRLADPVARGVDPMLAAAVRTQARESLVGALATYDGLVVDPFDRVMAAGGKPRQLTWARQEGLAVPRTVISNDPSAVLDLARRCDGALVAKPIASLDVASDDGTRGMYTSRLGPDDLAHIDEVRSSPMIFQEELPKSFEVRATVVDGRTYSVALRQEGGGDVDWRREAFAADDAWHPYDLPGDVAAGLVRLVGRFGLHYSAADFVVTPDGRHVFLESNPAGEWTWVDTLLETGVAMALARLLSAGPTPSVRR